MYFVCSFPGVYMASLICNFMITISLGKLPANFSSNIPSAPFSFCSPSGTSITYIRPFHHIPSVSYILFCILHPFVSQCFNLDFYFPDLPLTSLILSLAVSRLLLNLSTKFLIISSCVFSVLEFLFHSLSFQVSVKMILFLILLTH